MTRPQHRATQPPRVAQPSKTAAAFRSPHRWIVAGLVAVGLGLSMLAGAAAPVGAQAGATTSTLPTDNRQMGDIIPAPFTGVEPQNAGDPGGWLQVSLFFLLIGAITIMVGIVWFISRRARQRRTAAGLDPVAVAKRTGRGVRAAHRVDAPPADAPERSADESDESDESERSADPAQHAQRPGG